jgi:fumarate reductase subunit C
MRARCFQQFFVAREQTAIFYLLFTDMLVRRPAAV